VPETADVGDAGSVFAPTSGAHKRPRIEIIHQTVNKQNPPCKRICLGGGRVSGRSRDTLITGLISRADLVQQQTVALSPLAEDHGRSTERHLPPSFRRPGATVDPAIVRRYAERRAEIDAQVSAFRLRHPYVFFAPDMPRVSTATAQEPQPIQSEVLTEEPGTHAPGTQEPATPSQPASTQEVVAIHQEIVAPAPVVQVVQFTASGPVTLTAEQAVRRYSVIHAENVAAHAQWVAETEEAAQRWADSLSDTPQAIISGTAASQPADSQEVIAPTQVTITQEVVAPPPSTAQEVAPVEPTPQPIHTFTRPISSMLQAFAFEDTRSGYYDDYEVDFPLI